MTDRLEERVKRLEDWADELDGWLEEGAQFITEVAEQREKMANRVLLSVAGLSFLLGLTIAFALLSYIVS